MKYCIGNIWLTILLIMFAIKPTLASELNLSLLHSIYTKEIAAKGEGVWLTNGFAFFTVDQECLSNKKFSASEEKEAATVKLMLLIKNAINEHSLELDQSISKVLKNEVLRKFRYQGTNIAKTLSLSGVVVANEDTGHCNRRRTMAFPLAQYQQALNSIEKVDVNELILSAKSELLSSNQFKKLSEYAAHFKLVELTGALSISDSDYSVPFLSNTLIKNQSSNSNKLKADVEKVLKSIQQKMPCKVICENALKAISNLDIANTILKANEFNGLGKYQETSNEQKVVAEQFMSFAKKNFDKGQNAQQIIKDLSVSLLFSPNNINAWNMYGSVLRALNMPEYSLIAHTQALTLSPKNAETLFHIAKTHKALNNSKITSGYHNFILEHYSWLVQNEWSNAQIIELRKGL